MKKSGAITEARYRFNCVFLAKVQFQRVFLCLRPVVLWEGSNTHLKNSLQNHTSFTFVAGSLLLWTLRLFLLPGSPGLSCLLKGLIKPIRLSRRVRVEFGDTLGKPSLFSGLHLSFARCLRSLYPVS